MLGGRGEKEGGLWVVKEKAAIIVQLLGVINIFVFLYCNNNNKKQ